MAFELDISAASRGIIKIANFPDLAVEPIRAAITDVANVLLADIATDIQASGGGRLYRRGTRRFAGSRARNVRGGVAAAFHRASAPGRPPASDSGMLLRSLRRTIGRANSKRQIRGAVLAPAAYAFMLESGTRSIAPRPSFVPAAQRHVTEFVEKVTAAIDEAARKTSDQIGSA